MKIKTNLFDNITTLTQAISDDLTLISALQATELEAQTLTELKKLGFPDGLGLCLRSEKSITILNHLRSVVQQWPDKTGSTLLNDLAVDFTAIYLTAQLGAAPSESYWLDEEQLVMQKPMFEVRDLYREHGFKVENWRSRADDHLINELNFLSQIIGLDPALDKLPVAANFLDEHLLRWLGEFSERVAGRCEGDFYSGLVLLTAAYCEELRDLLAIILEDPRPSREEVEARIKERAPKEDKLRLPECGSGSGPTW